jgi:hypothetical protein
MAARTARRLRGLSANDGSSRRRIRAVASVSAAAKAADGVPLVAGRGRAELTATSAVASVSGS